MAKSILSQESPHLRRRLLPSGRITRIMTFTMMASELLNHKIIRMTQVYVVVVAKKKVEAVNLLGCVLFCG